MHSYLPPGYHPYYHIKQKVDDFAINEGNSNIMRVVPPLTPHPGPHAAVAIAIANPKFRCDPSLIIME